MRRLASAPPELRGYRHVSLLGSGGFSDVFLYDQELPRRRVAVKVLLLEELTPASRAAFTGEANLMAQLSSHPYIVTIYHADVADDGRPYFVMEYCSGPSLADRYKQAPLPVVEALRTGVRLSSAVAIAHHAGILHRDIKPANVLSNDYGWPALTDFGISSAVDDELPLHTTTLANGIESAGTESTSGQVGLSVPWSPPEMFDDDPEPDVRSDVFSLAATIWTVLAGQTPFEVRGRSNGTLDLIGRIERGAITPMDRDDVPRSLIAVLQKGMATDRTQRFATAIDFGRALQRVEIELGYARTELEIPNLQFEAPARSDSGEDADETQVRSVATINAQQPQTAPSPSQKPQEPSPAAAADETQVRGAPAVIQQQPLGSAGAATAPIEETVVRRLAPTAADATNDASAQRPPSHEPPPTRSRRVLIIVLGAVAALVTAAVVVGLVVTGAEPADEGLSPGATNAPVDQGAVVPETIDAPVLIAAPLREGATVTFEVENPDPLDDDQIIWRVSNRAASEQLRPAEEGRVVVSDYVDGSTLCVEVSVRRAGKLSEPLEVCYP